MAESRMSSSALPSTQAASQTGSNPAASAPYLRHRPPGRSATSFGEPSFSPPGPGRLRRGSTFSDTVSEARNSIKSSTDDLFLPRVTSRIVPLNHDNESHWQSAPLALALFPAVGGLLFKNGSAVATDITLLVLAAVFLNWSVRLPWDWYRSAQEVDQRFPSEDDFDMDVIIEEPEDAEAADGELSTAQDHHKRPAAIVPESDQAKAAKRELRYHELVALASCFIFPIIGAWVLHTIRSQLSRPSEGLVSNYNLTVFLLAAEIRPFSHLLKMVQGRTLYLQRVVASSSSSTTTASEKEKIDASKIRDLATRLEELEAHIAESAAQKYDTTNPLNPPPSPSHQKPNQKHPDDPYLVTLRNSIKPDLEALNRAMRRYEKRTALTAIETETRLQQLEKRINDAISLSVTTQRRKSAAERRSPLLILLDWLCAVVVVPVQMAWEVVRMPHRIAGWCLRWAVGVLTVGIGCGGNGDGDEGKGERKRDRGARGSGGEADRRGDRGSMRSVPASQISISKDVVEQLGPGSSLSGGGKVSMATIPEF
ncbi:hypothetical protein FQN50_008065 [Emmonsiellopsis sp. PD_5]|nr:hypothetical protein FQN50_008065 [Emmonsiellopsis sp. PD_5]